MKRTGRARGAARSKNEASGVSAANKRSANESRGRNSGQRKSRPKQRSKPKRVAEPRRPGASKPVGLEKPQIQKPQSPIHVSADARPLDKESRQAGSQTRAIGVEKEVSIPATFDNFDIDDILSGGVDSSPLLPSSTVPENQTGPAGVSSESSERSSHLIGVIGSMLGGGSGLLASLILLMTGVADFSGTPLGWIGKAFYGAHTGSFGSGDMSDRAVSLFMGAGWGLKLLGVLIGIVSLFLLLRVGFRIAAQRQVFGWARPTLATLGVICLFALMGLLFVQSVHHSELLHGLIDFAGEPLEGLLPDGENNEPFKEIRQQYKAENREFMIGVVSFSVLPLLAFGGAVTSLFFDEK